MTRQIEKRLLNEYLWEFYKEKPQWKRVRLGQVPDREMAQLYKVGLSWADAIVYDAPKIVIIETKIRADPRAIGQLEHYDEMFKVTPEFSRYERNPVELQLVTTIEDMNVRNSAENKGIKYIVYKPAWVEEYWKERLAKKDRR